MVFRLSKSRQGWQYLVLLSFRLPLKSDVLHPTARLSLLKFMSTLPHSSIGALPKPSMGTSRRSNCAHSDLFCVLFFSFIFFLFLAAYHGVGPALCHSANSAGRTSLENFRSTAREPTFQVLTPCCSTHTCLILYRSMFVEEQQSHSPVTITANLAYCKLDVLLSNSVSVFIATFNALFCWRIISPRSNNRLYVGRWCDKSRTRS